MTDRRLAASLLFGFLLLALAVVGPWILDLFVLLQLTTFAALAMATLGLAFAWGAAGILSFGHAAFFGLGAYAYAIATVSLGDSTFGVLLGVLVPTIFSVLLGYFLFFGRVGDVYLGVLTLCVTLIFFSFMSSTADPAYRIAGVQLGGFNGISGLPPLNVPGDGSAFLSPEAMFRFVVALLAVVYVLVCLLDRSAMGRVIAAIRVNELRSELLGYDARLYKMGAFAVSAAAAGLGGALYTANTGYVGPNVFDLNQASQFLLWVVAGGLGTFVGPLLASLAFQFLGTFLGTTSFGNAPLVFGTIIVFFVIVVPQGLLPTFGTIVRRLGRVRRPRRRAISAEER